MLQTGNVDYKVVKLLIDNKVIIAEQKELYIYGVKQLRRFLLNIATSLIIGIVLNMVYESILFSIFFIPLRQFAGGYHARSPKICYISSVSMIVFALATIYYMPINFTSLVIIITLTLIFIWIKAPVESANKPLTTKEKCKFRRYTLSIFCIESLIAIATYFISVEIWSKCILVSMLTITLLLLLSPKAKY